MAVYPIYRINRRRQVENNDVPNQAPVTNPIVDERISKAMKDMTGAAILSTQIAATISKNKPQRIIRNDDGSIRDIYEFYPTSGKKKTKSSYLDNKLYIKKEYDEITGKKIQQSLYTDGGKSCTTIDKFDSETGNIIESELYDKGKIVKRDLFETPFNQENNKPSKSIGYNNDNSVMNARVYGYDETTGNLNQTDTYYDNNIETYKFNPETGKVLSCTNKTNGKINHIE